MSDGLVSTERAGSLGAAAPAGILPNGAAAPRFYYGWVCVGAAALAMVATLPGRTMGLGLVTEPLLPDLGLSRQAYSYINAAATVLGAGFGLGAGRLIDRLGVRSVVAVVTLLLGLTGVALSRVAGPWGLLLAVTLTRGLGQSALSVASMAVVGKWFERRAGAAMGLYAVLVTVGFLAAMPLVQAAAARYGWRPAWGGMGLALAVGVAPVLWLVTRSTPESVGLRVDGVGPAPAAAADKAPAAGHTLGEALASPAFWALALAAFVFNAAFSGITLFNESILRDRGYAGPPTGPLAVMVLVGLPTNFVAGWLASRRSAARLMAVAMALLAASLVLLPLARGAVMVMLYAAVIGTAGGVVTVVFFACWGNVFGRRHLGKIQGAAQGLTVLASAAGPLVLAGCRAGAGSYSPAFYAAAAGAAVLAVACWAVPLPSRR